jgi:hypothetical protein
LLNSWDFDTFHALWFGHAGSIIAGAITVVAAVLLGYGLFGLVEGVL